jgi:hypothetical protein
MVTGTITGSADPKYNGNIQGQVVNGDSISGVQYTSGFQQSGCGIYQGTLSSSGAWPSVNLSGNLSSTNNMGAVNPMMGVNPVMGVNPMTAQMACPPVVIGPLVKQ